MTHVCSITSRMLHTKAQKCSSTKALRRLTEEDEIVGHGDVGDQSCQSVKSEKFGFSRFSG